MQYSYDIIIVGAGMSGLTLACLLAQQTDLSIAILDARPVVTSWDPTHYSYRVSAFSLASQRIFQKINVWERIKEKRLSPYLNMEVTDATSQGKIHFSADEMKTEALGYIIENNLVQMELVEQLQHYPQIKWVTPVELVSLQQTATHAILTTAQQEQYQAKLIIGADGAQSFVREQLNIPLDKIDYQQIAIVATVRTTLPHEKMARQVFLKTGPLAFLPLVDEHLSSLVWSLPAELANEYLTKEPEAFNRLLRQACSAWLGNIVACDDRHGFALNMQRAKHYVMERCVLIADAAHTVHPLAGQGINMGMLDVMALAENILEMAKNGKDLAEKKYLRRYERARKAENFVMQAGIHGLKNVFATQMPMLPTVVALGLNWVDKMPVVKKFLARRAMGK